MGKSPARVIKTAKVAKAELTELKRKLERAITDEAFEEAAQLRDQIRRAEQPEHPPKQKKAS